MKNNKGMILSTYVYMLLVFFLLLLGTMLVVLNNTKLLADKLKENAKDNPAINKDLVSLVLNGDDEMVIVKGDTFIDPGYIAKTQSGKSLTAKVEGNVDTSTIGEYIITYTIKYKQFSKMITRKVYVTDAIYEFDYTGSEQVFIAPVSGYYKLETWGAQGGSATYSTTSHKGGYGGYSTGRIYLNKGQTIYINVGGMGQSVSGITSYTNDTGYNGGSYGTAYAGNSNHGGGGGATHIATSTGLLKYLSSNKDSVIIVASGGGGASTHAQLTNYSGNGGSGGGVTGVAGITATSTCYAYGLGGTQTAGGSYTLCTGGYNPNMSRVGTPGFGYGSGFLSFSTGNGYEYAGGGGGYYGGGPGYHAPAGGGSGYIGNASLTQKSMYCYKCNASTSADTYTVSVENVSETAISNYAKEGNGYAKITYISG